MYDRFSGIKSWSSERNIENAMSDLYLMKKIHVEMKSFAPP